MVTADMKATAETSDAPRLTRPQAELNAANAAAPEG